MRRHTATTVFGLSVVLVCAVWTVEYVETAVSMNQQLKREHSVETGDDALLTCVVNNVQNETVVWRKLAESKLDGSDADSQRADDSRILTAGTVRVTSDHRLMSLHDEGGNVYVLVIKNTSVSDSGVYVCEVDDSQLLRTYHTLTVSSQALPLVDEGTAPDLSLYNFTSCCRRHNVAHQCLGFCSLDSISNGSSVESGIYCEPDFPTIVQCMADGRDHESCCHSQGVPQMCSHICRGEYHMQLDKVRDHFNCVAFSEITINCVARGLMTLPKAVSHLHVTVESPTELRIQWNEANRNTPNPDYYLINVTKLVSFDNKDIGLNFTGSDFNITTEDIKPSISILNVSYPNYSTTASELQPLTFYEISATAHNIHGQSIVSEKVRVVTWLPETLNYNIVPPPGLPDVKKCCQDSGVTEPRCLQRLCDPQQVSDTVLADVIICAPWAEKTFTCMADKKDHGKCCQARGLPAICVELCSGNVTQVDYRHFRCLSFMGSYTSCLMQGYGVVPSQPQRPRASLVRSTFAVIRWDKPAELSGTVQHYNLHYRKVNNADDDIKSISGTHSPYLLDFIQADTIYEFFVEAVNFQGPGAASNIIAFRTEAADYLENGSTGASYDLSKCCIMAEVKPQCMPLCHYDVKMSTFNQLSHVCADDYLKMMRCAGGGRDHAPCCRERGVPQQCSSVCNGQKTAISECVAFLGNIFQCFEQGVGVLPSPVRDFHVTSITNNSVELAWASVGEDIDSYSVQYSLINPTSRSALNGSLMNQTLNVTSTGTNITSLIFGNTYTFQVTAQNSYGSSLPTSTVTVNITNSDNIEKSVSSHPHSLTVNNLQINGFQLSWSAPMISHPEDRIRYNIYWKDIAENQNFTETTKSLSHTFSKLSPGSAYSIYVTSLTDSGESMPSESLHVWTLPADPASVFEPVVKSKGNITEGGTIEVLCEAIGMPTPTITLFLNGMLVHSEKTFKLSTLVKSITRDLNQVLCMAQNGVGQPSQSTLVIDLQRKPIIRVVPSVRDSLQDTATLKCHVNANPKPTMQFFTDAAMTTEVPQDDIYQTIVHDLDVDGTFLMELKINRESTTNVQKYYCFAENYLGSQVQSIVIKSRTQFLPTNDSVALCCQQRNVSAECLPACSFDIDFNAVSDKPQCIFESEKLMSCAADGSDHRQCCQRRGVPRSCLDFCRGFSVRNPIRCSASYAEQIFACFHEGQSVLPGPPRRLHVEPMSSESVRLMWEEPVKNSDKVQEYRVYWRRLDGGSPVRNDTAFTWMLLADLEPGARYEYAVKAGNHYGASRLSGTMEFSPGRLFVSSSKQSHFAWVATVAILVVVTIIVIFSLLVIWFYCDKCHCSGRQTDLSQCLVDRDTSHVPMSDLDVVGGAQVENTSLETKPKSQLPNIVTLAHNVWIKATTRGFKQFQNEQ